MNSASQMPRTPPCRLPTRKPAPQAQQAPQLIALLSYTSGRVCWPQCSVPAQCPCQHGSPRPGHRSVHVRCYDPNRNNALVRLDAHTIMTTTGIMDCASLIYILYTSRNIYIYYLYHDFYGLQYRCMLCRVYSLYVYNIYIYTDYVVAMYFVRVLNVYFIYIYNIYQDIYIHKYLYDYVIHACIYYIYMLPLQIYF